jgi:hypothetical protein
MVIWRFPSAYPVEVTFSMSRFGYSTLKKPRNSNVIPKGNTARPCTRKSGFLGTSLRHPKGKRMTAPHACVCGPLRCQLLSAEGPGAGVSLSMKGIPLASSQSAAVSFSFPSWYLYQSFSIPRRWMVSLNRRKAPRPSIA